MAEAVQFAAALLGAAGIPRARFEARLLVAYALGVDTAAVFARPERPVAAVESARLAELVRRRADHEPMAYLTGIREFWSLPLRVSPATLIPRPESEGVVEAALARLPAGAPRVLDLGTGSGCLLLALLSERPDAVGIGIDCSAAALDVARTNGEALGVADRAAFVCGDWGQAIAGKFHAIVCNPPYISDGECAALPPDVARFEPRVALSGGRDGLDAYRRILPDMERLLAADGVGVLEIGCAMAAAVTALIAEHRLQLLEMHKDLAGRARCVVVTTDNPPAW